MFAGTLLRELDRIGSAIVFGSSVGIAADWAVFVARLKRVGDGDRIVHEVLSFRISKGFI
jgi:hypothetical protein